MKQFKALLILGLLFIGAQAKDEPWLVDVGISSIQNVRDGGIRALYKGQDAASFDKPAGQEKFYFGVFDGHGKTGGEVSQYIYSRLLKQLQATDCTDEDIVKVVGAMQEELKDNEDAWKSGSTAVFAIFDWQAKNFKIANIGDSRLLVVRKGKEVFSTRDHKVNDPQELQKILPGGCVKNGYLYDEKQKYGLAITRTLGDCYLYTHGAPLSCEPDITDVAIKKGDIVILASDGLWDVMDNQQVMEFVCSLLKQGKRITDVADMLVAHARKLDSWDDITALLVILG